MEIESHPHMTRYHTVAIEKSQTVRAQNTHENRNRSTINHTGVLTKQTVSLPRPSESLIGNMELASVPVTPDPNAFLKSKTLTKCDDCSSRSSENSGSKTCKRSKDQDRRSHSRLNKFVRSLHNMLVREKHSGIVEWRRGLLVLFSTDAFSKRLLPRYFNTRNFKTFRRQLNYYGFVHVRSFSATGNTTTALWINQNLAEDEANDDVSAVLKLRRVEPNEDAKTVEGRRIRKALAIHTVEEDIGLNSKTLQLDQIQSMAIFNQQHDKESSRLSPATAFLRPYVSSSSSSNSSRCDQTHNCFHSESCGESESFIPRVDSKIYSDRGGSTSAICSSSSSNEEISAIDSSGLPPLLPKPRDEVTNTDAAASMLLLLSRS